MSRKYSLIHHSNQATIADRTGKVNRKTVDSEEERHFQSEGRILYHVGDFPDVDGKRVLPIEKTENRLPKVGLNKRTFIAGYFLVQCRLPENKGNGKYKDYFQQKASFMDIMYH